MLVPKLALMHERQGETRDSSPRMVGGRFISRVLTDEASLQWPRDKGPPCPAPTCQGFKG